MATVGGTRRVNEWVFYVTNPVDAPEHLVSGTGDALGSLDLRAFGEATPNQGARATTPLRFRGQYADEETGLHYNYTRHYDPALALYISADPTSVEGGIRLFAYVGNRPRTYTDPYGLADPLMTTTTNGTEVDGHSKGYHTNNGTTGDYNGPASLPSGMASSTRGSSRSSWRAARAGAASLPHSSWSLAASSWASRASRARRCWSL